MAAFLWGVAEAVRRIGELVPLPPVPDHEPHEKQHQHQHQRQRQRQPPHQQHGEGHAPTRNRRRLSAVVDGIFDVEEQQRAQTETIIRALVDQRPGTISTRIRALSRIPRLQVRLPAPEQQRSIVSTISELDCGSNNW